MEACLSQAVFPCWQSEAGLVLPVTLGKLHFNKTCHWLVQEPSSHLVMREIFAKDMIGSKKHFVKVGWSSPAILPHWFEVISTNGVHPFLLLPCRICGSIVFHFWVSLVSLSIQLCHLLLWPGLCPVFATESRWDHGHATGALAEAWSLGDVTEDIGTCVSAVTVHFKWRWMMNDDDVTMLMN